MIKFFYMNAKLVFHAQKWFDKEGGNNKQVAVFILVQLDLVILISQFNFK